MSIMPSSSGLAMSFEVLISQKDRIEAQTVVSSDKDIAQQMKAVEENLANGGTDLNRTPRQRPKRKKHRPKVIKEGKPAPKTGTLKSATPPNNKEITLSCKRKYVRKKNIHSLSLSIEPEEIADPTTKTGTLVSVTSGTPNNKEVTPSGKRKYVRKIKAQYLSENSFRGPTEITDPTPKKGNNEMTPSDKRKYVQKTKALNHTEHSSNQPAKIADPYSGSGTKSVRRRLNYDLEGQQARDGQNKECQAQEESPPCTISSLIMKSNTQNTPGPEVVADSSSNGLIFDIKSIMHPTSEEMNFADKQHRPCRTETMGADQMLDWQRIILEYSAKYWPPKQGLTRKNPKKLGNKSDYLNNASNSGKRYESGATQLDTDEITNLLPRTKRSRTLNNDGQISMHVNTMKAYDGNSLPFLPQGHKKQKMEPDQNTFAYIAAASSIYMPSSECRENQEHQVVLDTPEVFTLSNVQRLMVLEKQQSPQNMLTIEKARSQMPAKPHNLTSPSHSANKIMDQNDLSVPIKPFPGNNSQQGQIRKPQNLMETEVQQTKAKRIRTKCTNQRIQTVDPLSNIQLHRPTLYNLESSSALKAKMDKSNLGEKILHTSVIYTPEYQSISNFREINSGSLNFKELVLYRNSIDEITEKLRYLTIDGVSKNAKAQIQNAVVPYNGGGMMIPFKSITEPTKKRSPRPKVDLDPETNKVWKLLMGKESSDDVEGVNSEKEKWWHEERCIFRGRVDSFIARMHLVQGDRHFSKWKGSVVDSVVGVFLTQNVSDHLSSSAFMALAAKFPLRSRSKKTNFSSEKENLCVESQASCVIDLDDTITVQEQILDQNYSSRSYLETMEEDESANIKELFGSSIGASDADSSKFKGLYNNETTPKLGTCLPDSASGTPFTLIRTSVAEAEDRWSVEDVVSSQSSSKYTVLTAAGTGLSSLSNIERQDSLMGNLYDNGMVSSISFMELLCIAEGMPANSHGQIDRFSYSEVENRSSFLKQLGNISSKNSLEFNASVHFQDAEHVGPSAAPSMFNHVNKSSSCRLMKLEAHNILSDQTRPYEHQITSEIEVEDKIKTMDTLGGHLADNMIEVTSQRNSELIAETVSAVDLNEQTSNGGSKPLTSWQAEAYLPNQFQCLANLQTNIIDVSIAKTMSEKFPHLQEHCTAKFQKRDNIQYQDDSIQQEVQSQKLYNQEEFQKLPVKQRTSSELSKGVKVNIKDDASSSKKFSAEITKGKLKQKVKDDTERKMYEWDNLRKAVIGDGTIKERSHDTMDSVDWEAVRCADVNKISETIRERGMNNILAERIKDFLNRLVTAHGRIDLEWLRDVEPDKAKDYLLSIRGLGLKSVECVRLLTLHHMAFPVDTNVGRICVRLGWVPLQPLPESLQLHLLELYPVLETIQRYLWPRLCKLDQLTLYELHYQMITFGKVFCTKSKPNCNACPMRGECKHFASAFASARLALPGPEVKSLVVSTRSIGPDKNCMTDHNTMTLLQVKGSRESQERALPNNCEPIVEEPATPEAEYIETEKSAIEDAFYEDPDEIPTIKLNFEEFAQNLQIYMQANNMEIQYGDMSKALVAISPEAASIPMPKLKNVSRLRTEHHVYELPDSHPLLEGFDQREPDDPSSYLLAIWTPGETAQSTDQPQPSCNSQEVGQLCASPTCSSCNRIREAESQTVRGTFLIPCRTAMRGSFPLNGTYFQVNEVFADHDTSCTPISVPREWIWNLPRRTVYFGTSVPTIFKGLTTEEIQQCFWRGFICVRGFDRKTRAPRPLYARLHFPASKAIRNKKAAAAAAAREE